MKRYLYIGVLCLLVATPATRGQQLFHSIRLGDIRDQQLHPEVVAAFSDTLKVLAIMVEFVADTDPLTSGDGAFERPAATPQRIIDAPPRDSAFFAHHLLFAENYFRKASNGQQYLKTIVLGATLQLPKQMKYYSTLVTPTGVGDLVEDSWKAAVASYQSFPFKDYDLFIIFHAGVGKDIDLRGSLGYDPTPYDLPSFYINLSGLKQIMGTSYQGVEAPAGSGFRITNSIILPETENRILPALGGDFLYQLSTNGLLVANIASYLGLPDLFDTKTGRTAIGRFGLMDGQSIFSFKGLFPPEPSAWEKKFLGWTTPIVIMGGTKTCMLPSVGLENGFPLRDSIVQVPINAKEYFLVENRYRDSKKDGQTVTMQWKGQQIVKWFGRDTVGFNNYALDSIYGVVTDVDDLDWSLPGAVGYLGGILIWHIDENVITKGLSTNSINTVASQRGVDLEEADGSQDIGQSYGMTDPGSGSEDGSPIDYWHKENESPVFMNEFGESTNPNSLASNLTRSHVRMYDFDAAGPRMSFKVDVGTDAVRLKRMIRLGAMKRNQDDAPVIADLGNDGKNELIYVSGDSIFVLNQNLSGYARPSGLFSPFGGQFQPTVISGQFMSAISTTLAGVKDSLVFLFAQTGDTLMSVNVGAKISAPLASEKKSQPRILAGDSRGNLSILTASTSGGISISKIAVGTTPIRSISALSPGNEWAVAFDDKIVASNGNNWSFAGKQIRAMTFSPLKYSNIPGSPGSDVMEQRHGIVLLSDETVAIFQFSSQTISSFAVRGAGSSFAVADIDGDGYVNILVGTENGLSAYSPTGVLADGFPRRIPTGEEIVGHPLIVALGASGKPSLFFSTTSGRMYGYDNLGDAITGFPISVGELRAPIALGKNLMTAVSADSFFYVWEMGTSFDSVSNLWNGYLGDIYHKNMVENLVRQNIKSTELLPSRFAYNWPNPVYENNTNIRYHLSAPATVTIRIFTMAGELVKELQGTGYGGIDNEVVWDVSHVQSGVYFGRIHAVAASDEMETIIKIAVIK